MHFLKFFFHIRRSINSAWNISKAQEILKVDPELATYLAPYRLHSIYLSSS